MQDLGSNRLIAMFAQAAASIEEQRDYLSDLDGAIADADHGMTMSLGFRAVTSALAKLDPVSHCPSNIFRAAASAFLDAVGASTGPLYASGFLNAAKHLEGKRGLGAVEQAAVLEGIAAGISARGKGGRGEKTMLDVWLPAAEAAQQALRENPAELWTYVRRAAADGVESTRSMMAMRGRAARVGERSIGHLDPGAVSALLIVEAMADTLGDDNSAI